MNEVERVKEICKERKIAISRLEKACGFSNGYIRSLKKGEMPSDRLYAVSVYLRLPMEYLLTGENPPRETLTQSELDILRMFRQLNVTGQSEAIERISEMLALAKFTRESMEGKVG